MLASPRSSDDARCEPRKLRTHRAILAAAAELYEPHGIHETSVEAIAERAGVSIGSVYSHFGSKDGLAFAVASDALRELEDQLATVRSCPTAAERATAAGHAYLNFAVAHPAIARYLATRAMSPEPSPPGRAAINSVDASLRRSLLATASDLKQAMQDGHLPTMPVDELIVCLWGLCAGVTDMVCRRDSLAITPDLAERALRLGAMRILGVHLPTDHNRQRKHGGGRAT